jgi:S-phase kinase-associated protein 1
MATMISMMSSDSQKFEVPQDVAFESTTVKNLIEDSGAEEMIPLPNVSGKILAKVIEYCKYHVEAAKKGPDGKVAKTEEEVKVCG